MSVYQIPCLTLDMASLRLSCLREASSHAYDGVVGLRVMYDML